MRYLRVSIYLAELVPSEVPIAVLKEESTIISSLILYLAFIIRNLFYSKIK